MRSRGAHSDEVGRSFRSMSAGVARLDSISIWWCRVKPWVLLSFLPAHCFTAQLDAGAL
jgi:hypothetical protein